jgi:uncharacterized membrane protein YgdD (TMEM256/DUF423 family)
MVPETAAPAAATGAAGLPPAARIFLVIGGLNAALAVALGAAAAHAWKARLTTDDPGGLFALALQYHQLHALGLMLVGLALRVTRPSRLLDAAGGLIIAGLLLFCGSLYLRSLFGITSLHALVPFGGGAFIAGWLLFAVGVARRNSER